MTASSPEARNPYRWSQEVGMEDGSRRTFSYWTADIA